MFGFDVAYQNGEELDALIEQVFVRGEYAFSPVVDAPVIVDGGSHIGLSVLYFKRIFPFSKILAFEPDPESFELLRRNVENNRLTDVDLINAALANTEGHAVLYSTVEGWAWGNSLIPGMWGGTETARSVRSVQLSHYLNCEIHLLKLNIEGVEDCVLRECGAALSRVHELIVEVHPAPSPHGRERCESVLDVIEEARFALEPDRNAARALYPPSLLETEGGRPFLIRGRRIAPSPARPETHSRERATPLTSGP